jgi:AraC-like DNA-binding protein
VQDFPSEIQTWKPVGDGWRPLFGFFRSRGFSFEWHDFKSRADFDWGQSFHPDGVELCLNLAGKGTIGAGLREVTYFSHCAGFYWRGESALRGSRELGQQHRFITVEYSRDFLRDRFRHVMEGLHPVIGEFLSGRPIHSGMTEPQRLKSEHERLIESLRQPPVLQAAQPTWFESKALELAASFFFSSNNHDELFCHRQKRLAQERCEDVIAILRADLSNPPTLEEIGKKVGCSQFHLSRTFSKEMGKTIAQYLRKLRMEKAAELLQSGKYNVTEAALEVGYSSLSHFSQAFHETYGCCPGLYGIAPGHSES